MVKRALTLLQRHYLEYNKGPDQCLLVLIRRLFTVRCGEQLGADLTDVWDKAVVA